jgi:hypothetical protein
MQSVPITYLAQPVRTGRPGRPRIEINSGFLRLALESSGSTSLARSNIAASRSTISRRAIDYGIRARGLPVSIQVPVADGGVHTVYPGRQRQPRQLSPDQLDGHIKDALTLFPHFGRSMLSGYLRSLGFRVTRDDIVAAFRRVNGAPARFGHLPIERRVYKVAGPNSLWHHDGHHSMSRFTAVVSFADYRGPELIRWKIITHAFVFANTRC